MSASQLPLALAQRHHNHQLFADRYRYYEVDLRNLAEADNVDAFLYFYAFFRRAAFAPATAEPLALEALLRESSDYATPVA
jgi:hypothetical protein